MTSEFEQNYEFLNSAQSDNFFSISPFEGNYFVPHFQEKQIELFESLNSEEKEEKDFYKKLLFLPKEKNKTKELTNESQSIIKKDNCIFKIEKFMGNKTNREKKPLFKKVGNRNHDKYDIDNILTVVQNHYINFIVMFINFFLEKQGINEKFIKISYEEKRKVNKENFENLKTKCLYEILLMKITPKNSRSPDDHNKILYTKVKDLPIIKDILNLNYLYFFQNIYYKNERNIMLNIDGLDKPFNLSDRKLVLYNELLSSFSNEYYISLCNRYVKEKYFGN
jgi:hypothetical protein